MLVLEVTRWEMTGNSFSLLQQQKKHAARVPVFESLQMLLSAHISIALFRQHLKGCPAFFKHSLSLEEHTKLSNAGFLPPPFSTGNVECIFTVTTEGKKMCKWHHVSPCETFSSCLSQENVVMCSGFCHMVAKLIGDFEFLSEIEE